MKFDEWDFRLIRSLKRHPNYGEALVDCHNIWRRRCALPNDTKLPLTYYIAERMAKIAQELNLSLPFFINGMYDDRLWMVGASSTQPYYERVFCVLGSFLANLPSAEIPGYKEWAKETGY